MYLILRLSRIRELTQPDIDVLVGDSKVKLVLTHTAEDVLGMEGTAVVNVELVGRRLGALVGFDLDEPEFCVRIGGDVISGSGPCAAEYRYYATEVTQMVQALAELRAPPDGSSPAQTEVAVE